MSRKNTVQKKKNSTKPSKAKPEPVILQMPKKAGRPKGTGKYGCETKAMRVPTHLIPEVMKFIERKLKSERKAA